MITLQTLHDIIKYGYIANNPKLRNKISLYFTKIDSKIETIRDKHLIKLRKLFIPGLKNIEIIRVQIKNIIGKYGEDYLYDVLKCAENSNFDEIEDIKVFYTKNRG